MSLDGRLIISKPACFSESDSECGYCHGKKDIRNKFPTAGWASFHEKDATEIKFQNTTIGFHAELFTAKIYEGLCDRGFRRSGRFIYRTDMLRNCCRLYTIRTNKSYLKMSKELKTCLRRFKKNIANATFKPKASYEDWVEELCDFEANSSEFRTVFEPASFSQEKFELYARYQQSIHGDKENSPKQFKSFLCDSPFSDKEKNGNIHDWKSLNDWRSLKSQDNPLTFCGPVHECYYHENKLIAISVLDFLPSGISSVYFIWDPDYSKWSLGKVSALREIALITQIKRPYYYLGYYIQDCPKMIYKAKFGGEILDICNNRYVPLSKIENMLENGGLFVASNEEIPTLDMELESGGNENIDYEKPLYNIADHLYGPNGVAYSRCQEVVHKLASHGVHCKEETTPDIYLPSVAHLDENRLQLADMDQLPNFSPGLMPLTELLTLFKSNNIDQIDSQCMLYDMELGSIRFIDEFISESPSVITTISNVIRLIGLENVKQSLIII